MLVGGGVGCFVHGSDILSKKLQQPEKNRTGRYEHQESDEGRTGKAMLSKKLQQL